MTALTMPERLAVVEIELVRARADISNMDDKLDQLLALRHKGAGVFWLVSTIIGTGVIGMLSGFLSIFKGH